MKRRPNNNDERNLLRNMTNFAKSMATKLKHTLNGSTMSVAHGSLSSNTTLVQWLRKIRTKKLNNRLWYNTAMTRINNDGTPDKRFKKKKEVEKKESAPLSAQEELAQFLEEKKIVLDYSVVETRLLSVEDGFVLTPKKPLIKVSAKYAYD